MPSLGVKGLRDNFSDSNSLMVSFSLALNPLTYIPDPYRGSGIGVRIGSAGGFGEQSAWETVGKRVLGS